MENLHKPIWLNLLGVFLFRSASSFITIFTYLCHRRFILLFSLTINENKTILQIKPQYQKHATFPASTAETALAPPPSARAAPFCTAKKDSGVLLALLRVRSETDVIVAYSKYFFTI